jgi:hypothetical protein
MKKRGHRRWWKIGFAVGGVLIGLLLLEGVARLAGLAPDYKFYPGPFIADSDCDYQLAAEYVGAQGNVPVLTDSFGLRFSGSSDFIAGQERDGILLLGDSVTFGWGVPFEESFAGLLEARVRELSDPALPGRVMNAGTPGYGAWHYRRYLESRFDELQPSLVVLVLFSNDWEGRVWEVNPEGSLTPAGLSGVRSGIAERVFNNAWCSRHSALYRLLKNALRNFMYSRNAGFAAAVSQLFCPSAYADLSSAGKWRDCFEDMQKMRSFLDERGVPLVVLDITRMPGVYRLMVEEAYDVIRFADGFSAEDGELLPHDSHPNAAGHRRLFGVLWKGLVERGFYHEGMKDMKSM